MILYRKLRYLWSQLHNSTINFSDIISLRNFRCNFQMQSVLGHQAGRPAVRDMTNTGDATRTLNMNQVSTTRYRRHLECVCVQSVDDAPTHMQCTVKVYFTHFGKYDSSMSIVQSLYCAPPPSPLVVTITGSPWHGGYGVGGWLGGS